MREEGDLDKNRINNYGRITHGKNDFAGRSDCTILIKSYRN